MEDAMNYGYPDSMSGPVAYAPAEVRTDFIRKVYGLLFLSLLTTVVVGGYCAQPALAPVLLGMWPILAIAGFVCILALSFARKTSGVNTALLYLFAAIQGAIVG